MEELGEVKANHEHHEAQRVSHRVKDGQVHRMLFERSLALCKPLGIDVPWRLPHGLDRVVQRDKPPGSAFHRDVLIVMRKGLVLEASRLS